MRGTTVCYTLQANIKPCLLNWTPWRDNQHLIGNIRSSPLKIALAIQSHLYNSFIFYKIKRGKVQADKLLNKVINFIELLSFRCIVIYPQPRPNPSISPWPLQDQIDHFTGIASEICAFLAAKLFVNHGDKKALKWIAPKRWISIKLILTSPSIWCICQPSPASQVRCCRIVIAPVYDVFILII